MNATKGYLLRLLVIVRATLMLASRRVTKNQPDYMTSPFFFFLKID